MILPARETAAKIAISRFGLEASIFQPLDTDGVANGYGKKREDEWEQISTESVVRVYERGAPRQSRAEGGRYRMESPVLLFMRDSEIEEGYRVSYESALYEVDSLTFYPSHIEAETTSVN
ncbi:SPP1 gp16-like head completion protein [Halorubrum tailed virus 25]|uniref:SPP1 gp16-like head completion protein n=1 Tax=Halorubrum tailed virus 25 TaxID=2878006 RepID=A0AAE9BY75_9CAUD|nr:SPP1 gp16-like head completion protein [Halorubrum tailed virus 25]UBF22599.1 SPP1 gp16-like head completion protein [Halorubrum tailed virus 25]